MHYHIYSGFNVFFVHERVQLQNWEVDDAHKRARISTTTICHLVEKWKSYLNQALKVLKKIRKAHKEWNKLF